MDSSRVRVTNSEVSRGISHIIVYMSGEKVQQPELYHALGGKVPEVPLPVQAASAFRCESFSLTAVTFASYHHKLF